VRLLSRIVPRPVAILLSFVALLLVSLLAFSVLIPMLADQLAALFDAAPRIAEGVEGTLRAVMEPLADRGLLPGTPDELLAGLAADLFGRLENLVQDLLGGAFRFAGQAFYFAFGVLGALVVATYMLADARKMKAACLRLSPKAYRRDALELWDAFGFSLSRYVSGLALVMVMQGVLSALALWVLGVPYAAVLGLWVALTAVVPLLGAWIGAVPGILVALSVSPAKAAAVAAVFLIIQQLEGNFLTPRVMGGALRIHPVFVLLAVVGGGQLAGPVGVVLAVPTLAVLRVLLNFVRPRLRVPSGDGRAPDG
jgi:predicted PurR-regulated permease PerM